MTHNQLRDSSYWGGRTCEQGRRSTTLPPPSDYADYIPQDESAQALYRLYVQMGDAPLDAAVKVLKICVGEQP